MPGAVSIDEITVGDEPDAWRSAGFTVDDDGTCRIGRVRIRVVGRDGGKRILGWSLRGLDTDSRLDSSVDGLLDGLPTLAGTNEPAEPATHANGARLIDHLVLVTPDNDRTIAALRAIGLEPRRTRHTDTYGAPFLQTFFRAGDVIIELIGPEEPGDGATAFFGLAHTVADLDATRALLGEGLSEPKDAVQPGRRIATLRHREFDMSVATAFMSP